MTFTYEFCTEIERHLQHALYMLKTSCLPYSAAWELSVSLCSLSHSGEPPCFLPLDFCASVPTRSAGEIAVALKDNCPALEIYNMYHLLRVNRLPAAVSSIAVELGEVFDLNSTDCTTSPISIRMSASSFDNPWLEGLENFGLDRKQSLTTTNNVSQQLAKQETSRENGTHFSLHSTEDPRSNSTTSKDLSLLYSREISSSSFFLNRGKCKWNMEFVNIFVSYLESLIKILHRAARNH